VRNNQVAVRRAKKYLTNVQVTTVTGASHNVPVDRPNEVNRLVTDFVG
jgi:pimeloyl-ACP methyl ester carboxylesterase